MRETKPTPKRPTRLEWAEAICMKCGAPMILTKVLASPESREEYLSKGYLLSAWEQMAAKNEDHQLFLARCRKCDQEVCIAVENMVWPLGDGRFAVRFRGQYHLIGDSLPVDQELHPRYVVLRGNPEPDHDDEGASTTDDSDAAPGPGRG